MAQNNQSTIPHTPASGVVQSHPGPIDTQKQNRPRKTWKQALQESAPLLLPVAHDALTARLIELAGYPAYQIGGFALVGSRFAYPDIDLAQFGENSAVMRDTIAASSLPVLVDADDGYGDAKNVTRVVQGYEAMGASAIFLEDQQAPKRCGHMLGKKVVPAEVQVGKIRAAAASAPQPRDLHHGADGRACAARPRRGAAPGRTLPEGGSRRGLHRGGGDGGAIAEGGAEAARSRAGDEHSRRRWSNALGWTRRTFTRSATRCCSIPRRSSSA